DEDAGRLSVEAWGSSTASDVMCRVCMLEEFRARYSHMCLNLPATTRRGVTGLSVHRRSVRVNSLLCMTSTKLFRPRARHSCRTKRTPDHAEPITLSGRPPGVAWS